MFWTFGADCKQTNVRKLHRLRLRVSNLHKKTRHSIPLNLGWLGNGAFKCWCVADWPIRSVFFVSIDTNNQSACSIFGLWHAFPKNRTPGFVVFPFCWTRVTRTLGRLRQVPCLSFNKSIILCFYFRKWPRSQIRNPCVRFQQFPSTTFPRHWWKKWRISQHVHTSYPGLSFRAPGFNPYVLRAEGEFRG